MTAARHHGIIPQLTLTQRLGIAREYVGMTQAELAHELELSLATVQRAENGKSTPTRRTILAWAMATGIDLDWLETGKDPHPDNDPDGGQTVRHQGLEPRTRWFEAYAGHRYGNVLPMQYVAMKAAS